MNKLISYFLILLFGNMGFAQISEDTIQIPAVVESQLQSYQEKFYQVLSEECPSSLCSPVNCDVVRFLTLDEKQDSSLPGLETPQENIKTPQYKISQVKCEFTYESTLNNETLNSIKQRILAKAKWSGTQLQLIGRKLNPKSNQLVQLLASPLPQADLKLQDNKSQEKNSNNNLYLLIGMAALLLLASLVYFLSRQSKINSKLNPKLNSQDLEKTALQNSMQNKNAIPDVTTAMILNRSQHLKDKLNQNQILTEMALTPFLQNSDLKNLCLLLRHFGSESLKPFADKLEFKEKLTQLREAYQNYNDIAESNLDVWSFFDKIERYIVAAEVGSYEKSLHEEFSFIHTLDTSEFFHLLQILAEEDIALVLSFSPNHLQNAFYKKLQPQQISNLVNEITKTKYLSDKIVRERALFIRNMYLAKRTELKTVELNKLPVIEQLINTLEPKARYQLIQGLKVNHKELFDQVIDSLFLDESLLILPIEVLNEIFVSIPTDQIASYLSKISFADKILSRVNPVLANSIKVQFNFANSLDFIEDSSTIKNESVGRDAIVQQIRNQVLKGKINLKRINESLLES